MHSMERETIDADNKSFVRAVKKKKTAVTRSENI